MSKKLISVFLILCLIFNMFAGINIYAQDDNLADVEKDISIRVEGISDTIIAQSSYTTQKSTVYEAVYELLQSENIPMTASDSQYGKYIISINHETENTFKSYDGWMYAVNNVEGSTSIDSCNINDGDDIVLYYGGFSPKTYIPTVELSKDKLQVGEQFNVTLISTYYDWDSKSNVTVKIKDADIKLLDQAYTTDDEGQAVITAPAEKGTYSLEISHDRGDNYPLLVRTTKDITVTDPLGDITKPEITVEGLTDGKTVAAPELIFKVTVADNVDKNIAPIVKLNDAAVAGTDGEYKVTLKDGENIIAVEATDASGNKENASYKIVYKKESPFDFDAATGTIKGYKDKKPPETLVIPSEIDGIQVKKIGEKAFYYSTYGGKISTQIKELELPGGLEIIDKYAFQGNLLETIAFPEGVTEISERAFYGNKLNNISLPGKLTLIGADAFYNNKLQTITIPDKVTEIGDSAFKENLLNTVNLPHGLKKIGKQAFALNNIESITIPESVTELPTASNSGIVWRNFADADIADKVQRYTKVYNNSKATDENSSGLVNPASVTIKYKNEKGQEVKPSVTVVGKEVKKLQIRTEGYKTIEEIVAGTNEYLADYNTCTNKYNDYKFMADLGANYFRIDKEYEFLGEEIGGYNKPDNQKVKLEQKDNEIIFVYKSAGEAALALEGGGMSSYPVAGNIGKNTKVEVKIVPPFGKEIDSFTVNGADKKAELEFKELEYIYKFKILENTSIKVTYKDIDTKYDKELKIELDRETIKLGQKAVLKAFYRGERVSFPNSGITWTVDHNDIAVVDSNIGEVTALKSGTVAITAILRNRPDVMASISLNIEPVSCRVRVEANDHAVVPLTEVIIDNLDLSKYGITTKHNTPKAIHAIIKALESVKIDCTDSAKGLEHGGGNYITMVDGLKTNSINKYYDGWMYHVDNAYATVGVGEFEISDGKSVVLYFQEDYTKNTFSWFDKEEITANTGENVELALTGSFYDMWKDTSKTGPIDAATILINDKEYKLNDVVVKSDAEGKVSLIFDREGTYIISAEKKDVAGRRILTRPYCKVVIKDKQKEALRQRVEAAIDGASQVILTNHYSMDWVAVGLARAGKDNLIPETYLQDKEAFIKDPENDDTLKAKPTEFERMTLGILAAGGDPTNVGGHNLIKQIYTGNLEYQGINAIVFGLLAIDSGDYYVPSDVIWTREKLINRLISAQCADGGWNLGGNGKGKGDPDMTGMTMTALAPYNSDEHPEVKAAISKAVDCLSALQQYDGGYKSWGTANSENCAQAIMGLCSNGVDPTGDKFTKNGKNLLDALLSFEVPEHKGFAHTRNKDGILSANGMATEQALYALNQYIYFADGKGSIYSWGKQAAAEEKTVIVRIEGKNNAIVTKEALKAKSGSTTVKDAVKQVLTERGIAYTENTQGFTMISGETADESSNEKWLCSVENGSAIKDLSSRYINNSESIVVYLGKDSQDFAYTWLEIPRSSSGINTSVYAPHEIKVFAGMDVKLTAKGYVYDSEKKAYAVGKVSGAQVYVNGQKYKNGEADVFTNEEGEATVNLLQQGSFEVTIKKDNMRAANFLIATMADMEAPIVTFSSQIKDEINVDVIDFFWATPSDNKDSGTDITWVLKLNGVELEPTEIREWDGARQYSQVAFDKHTNVLEVALTDKAGNTQTIKRQIINKNKTEVDLPEGDKPKIEIPKDDRDYEVVIKAEDKNKELLIEIPSEKVSRVAVSLPINTELPKVEAVKGDISAVIPQGTKIISGNASAVELLSLKDKTAEDIKNKVSTLIPKGKKLDSVDQVFSMGGNGQLVFSDYIALTLKNMKGKDAAYIQNGSIFIIQKYPSDSDGRNSGKIEYSYDSGNDLIVKTKHFTDFIAYAISNTGSDSGNPGGGNPGGGSGNTPQKSYVTLSIDKLTINRGSVINAKKVELKAGDTVWTLTKREMDGQSISYRYKWYDKYDSVYVQSIAGDGEFDHGSGSGWMYNVNGWYPNYGASKYTLKDGDVVQWRYTTSLGADLGEDISQWENPGTGGSTGGTGGSGGSAGGSTGGSTGSAAGSQSSAGSGTAASKAPSADNNDKAIEIEKLYNDINYISAWALDAVKKATDKGFINGSSGRFNPKANITRAEFIKIIVAALGIDIKTDKVVNFTDVGEDKWFYPYINAAYKAGIIKGSGSSFNPDEKITREHMAVIIARALNIKASKTTAAIKDINNVSAYAESDVEAIVSSGLMSGYDGRFNPKDPATREMAAVVAVRVYDFKNGNKAEEKSLVIKENKEATELIEKTAAVMQKTITDPVVASIGGEWTVLGLARSGQKVPQEYYEKYYRNVERTLRECSGKLHHIKYTEYDRVILALTSLGKNIDNVAGYNLREPLADFDTLIKQGINGPIFALIALDSNNYEMPIVKGVKTQTTRDLLVDFILKREINGGGWALGEKPSAPDPDITAMAIQGLTPYYGKSKEVKAAVDRGLEWLSKVQKPDGGYASWGSINSESIAQVVVALTGLGIDPDKDARFIKNGNSAVDALMTFSAPNGGFYHVKPGGTGNGGAKPGEVDPMATDQAMYALVAYDRFVNGQNRLYDMTDVK